MPSETQRMPTSYLRSVLLDGAKPFLYRSGVRSLLGVPDSGEGDLVFSPTTSLVGFTYPNSQFIGEPYVPQYSPDLTVSSALGMQGVGLESPEEIVPTNVQAFTPSQARAGKITRSKLFQAEESGENGVMPKGMAQQSATTPESSQQSAIRPASKQERISFEPSEIPERPGTIFERTTIDIPGASERSQDFPSLALPEQTQPLSNKAEEQSQPQRSPKQPRPSTVARLLSVGQENELQSTTTISAAHASEGLSQAASITRHVIVNPATGTGVPVQSPPPGRGRVRVGVEHIGLSTLPPPSLPSPLEGEGVTDRRCVDTYARRTGEKSTVNSAFKDSGHIDLGTGNGSSRAADRIEQLRTAVHELAAKKSPQREQTRDEAQPQQQQTPPPLQQIVIVRQPSSQARIPHAFWERSYLSRVRTRILR